MAPFSEDQVNSLNGFQQSGVMHEFTCANRHTPIHGIRTPNPHDVLIATTEGWRCEVCDYTQDWAHNFMADWSWTKIEKVTF